MNCIDLTPKGLRRSKRLQGPPRSRIERECDVVLREVLSYCGVASFMVLGETCNLLRRRTAHLVATGHVDRTLSVRHSDTSNRNDRDAMATLQAISIAGLKKQLRHPVNFDFPAYGIARKFGERARCLFRKARSIPSIGVLGIQYLDMPPALDLSPSLRVLTLYRCNGKVAVRKMKRMWLLRISEPENGDGTLLANVHSPPPNLKKLQYTANCNTYTDYLRETHCTMTEKDALSLQKLETLHITARAFSGIKYIGMLPALRQLKLCISDMSDTNVGELNAAFANLHTLSLQCASLHERTDVIQSLDCPALVNLHLQSAWMNYLNPALVFTQVKTLDIETNWGIGSRQERFASTLSTLPQLKRLGICASHDIDAFKDCVVDAIANMPSLELLCLRGLIVTRHAREKLKLLPDRIKVIIDVDNKEEYNIEL